MLSEGDFLAMGGGFVVVWKLLVIMCSNGKFSLYIDGDLYRGVSAVTPTFSNTAPLCGRNGEFVVVGLEIWGFID
jgi:hypothetical protein